jgi:hypothetical protein
MATMSVTQGLAELKLLEKRISKSLDRVKWTDVSFKNNVIDTEKFKKIAESEYQSYIDLLNRREIIKRAIVLKNATSVIELNNWKGTVAEAIEKKAHIEYKKNLLTSMKTSLTTSQNSVLRAEAELESRLDKLLQSELGKDIKTNPETIQAITKSFKETNKVIHHDPLGLTEKIRILEQEIEDFETNIDWKLSEANGRNMISL